MTLNHVCICVYEEVKQVFRCPLLFLTPRGLFFILEFLLEHILQKLVGHRRQGVGGGYTLLL